MGAKNMEVPEASMHMPGSRHSRASDYLLRTTDRPQLAQRQVEAYAPEGAIREAP